MLKDILENINESMDKWVIKKSKSGKRYLFWGDTSIDTYIIIYHYDQEAGSNEFNVSYYAFGGGSGNDWTTLKTVKDLPKYYQENGGFEDVVIPAVPTKLLKNLDEIGDDEVDTIPYK